MSNDINQAGIKSSDSLYNQASHIWQSYSNYLTFSAPFIFFRALTPFRTNEPIATRLIEGGVLASIATAVEYGVTTQQLKDYSLSYLPIIASFLYKQNLFDSNYMAVKAAVAIGGTALANYAWEEVSLKHVMLPTVSYSLFVLNNVPKQYAFVLSAATTAMDITINSEQNYASWAAAGFVIADNLASKSTTQYKTSISVLASALSIKLSEYEDAILDQLFTPEHFMESYSSITQFVDPDNFNLALQRHLISTTNMQICMGFFGNYLVVGSQGLTNSLVAIGTAPKDQKGKAFSDFIYKSALYVAKYLAPYMAFKIPVELMVANNNKQLINAVENKLLENIVVKDNFIQAAKSNYTIPSYLKDISIIADDLKTIQSSIFGLPKILQLSNINIAISLGLGAIVVSDIKIKELFTYLTQLKQAYEDQRTKCESTFDRVTAYDKESAITISQKEGIDYTLAEWEKLQQCKHDNLLLETLNSRLIDIGQYFYLNDMLYTSLHVLVGYMSKEESIDVTELWLYTKALELTTDAILFKSKNIAVNEKIKSATTRLNELAKLLNSGENTIAKVDYKIDMDTNKLSISNLDFTRGDQAKKIHLYVDELELLMGHTYSVTGDNGSGKSSFTSLLGYIFQQIADPSFNVTSGNVVYPSNSIMMVPQKDYTPLQQSSLLDLILYPNQAYNLTQEDENEIVNLVNELQIFAHPITSKDLYQGKDDLQNLSGGQKKKAFMVNPLLECPKILILDETFAPLDPKARSLLMNKVENSCLNESIILVVWHKDKNEDGTSCVKEPFFDYELHVQNETIVVGEVGVDCIW